MSTFRHVAGSFLILALFVNSSDRLNLRAAEQEIVLELQRLLPGEKNLKLHLTLDGERIVGASAMAPEFNAFPHRVRYEQLNLDGRKLAGTLGLTILPDPWVPKDGRPIECELKLEVNPDQNSPSVKGTYEGVVGTSQRKGDIVGRMQTAKPREAPVTVKLLLHQAVARLSPQAGAKGPNISYALDMRLGFLLNDREVILPHFESTVPDYRGYSAEVTSAQLERNGSAFSLRFDAKMDHGAEPKPGVAGARFEDYRYELRGHWIDDALIGWYRVTVGELVVEDQPFWGSADRNPPPQASGSLVWLRLHAAMQQQYPVILHLSVSEDARIHGLSWIPRYNHQPHTVDASRLKLQGNRLFGSVTIQIVPDCYKPPEEIVLQYEIDTQITSPGLRGTFKGSDRGLELEGKITGDVRSKRPPTVSSLSKLKALELDFGVALENKGKSPGRLFLNADLVDGKPSTLRIGSAKDAQAIAVVRPELTLQLEGDEFSGTLDFEIPAGQISSGAYRYTFRATIDELRCFGYWRGTCNDRPILTKSAKFSAKFVAE